MSSYVRQSGRHSHGLQRDSQKLLDGGGIVFYLFFFLVGDHSWLCSGLISDLWLRAQGSLLLVLVGLYVVPGIEH